MPKMTFSNFQNTFSKLLSQNCSYKKIPFQICYLKEYILKIALLKNTFFKNKFSK